MSEITIFDGLSTTVGYLGSTNSSVLQFPIIISGTSYGYKNSSNQFVAFRGDSTDTYTYSSGSTGSTVDLGARNNYRYINATNVYNKGKSDGVTTHTGTYTFPSNDTGGTKDLGVNHSYRYVNASNVYNKGKADGYTTHTGTYTFAANDTGGTKDLGVSHTYRYVNAQNVYNKGKADGANVLSFFYVASTLTESFYVVNGNVVKCDFHTENSGNTQVIFSNVWDLKMQFIGGYYYPINLTSNNISFKNLFTGTIKIFPPGQSGGYQPSEIILIPFQRV